MYFCRPKVRYFLNTPHTRLCMCTCLAAPVGVHICTCASVFVWGAFMCASLCVSVRFSVPTCVSFSTSVCVHVSPYPCVPLGMVVSVIRMCVRQRDCVCIYICACGFPFLCVHVSMSVSLSLSALVCASLPACAMFPSMHLWECVFSCSYVCVSLWTCLLLSLHAYICITVCTCVTLSRHMCICTCILRVFLSVCMPASVWMTVYVCEQTQICTHLERQDISMQIYSLKNTHAKSDT
jgi:hypothetical protein